MLQIHAWLIAVGFSLGVGTVIAKLWRIYIVKNNYGTDADQDNLMTMCRHPRKAQRKVGITDWHLMVIIFGLIVIDVTILTIYTALEGFIAKFSAGREPNREKPSAIVGVSKL